MDHYKALGLSRSATKEEIKEAFRRLALKFHPDKHSFSPKEVRDAATLRFKQVSEAYEVLIDDAKRTDYNRCGGGRGGGPSSSSFRGGGYGYGYGRGWHSYRPRSAVYGDANGFRFDVLLKFLTTRTFLLNVAFASILFGGTVVIERCGDAIWEMQNTGKSFEEAMESIEQVKRQREKR